VTPEGKVKLQVKNLLKADGVFYYMPVQSGYGEHGVPDIIACVPVVVTPEMVGRTIGVFAGVETKAPGKIKNTTANQKRMLGDISKCCGIAIVADSTDIVKEALSTIRETGVAFYSVP
jgi:hypothetical protein